jgi:hypothetical protein
MSEEIDARHATLAEADGFRASTQGESARAQNARDASRSH